MAPVIGSDWQKQLLQLQANWDSWGAKPITAEAIGTVEAFHVVPTNEGGVQLEIHRDGYDIEIEISPEGKIESALICHDS